MKIEVRDVLIEGKKCKAKLMIIEQVDKVTIKKLYDKWRELCVGMDMFKARKINLPEGVSESAFCLFFSSARVLQIIGDTSGSFDTINLENFRREQIKATSVFDDLTSFGPNSIWDDIYWLDFYKDGKYDGTFDVYKIPNELIYTHKVNKNQTMKEQQAEKRRPRMRIRQEIIIPNNLRPIKICKL